MNTAADLGERGPDNDFGYGRLDAAALIDRAVPTSALPWLIIVAGICLLLAVGVAAIVRRRSRSVPPPIARRVSIDTRWQDLDS